jgi:hypothetical protein
LENRQRQIPQARREIIGVSGLFLPEACGHMRQQTAYE